MKPVAGVRGLSAAPAAHLGGEPVGVQAGWAGAASGGAAHPAVCACVRRAVVLALRWATGNPSGLSMLQLVGAGIATSPSGMAVAALVEVLRLATTREHGLVDETGRRTYRNAPGGGVAVACSGVEGMHFRFSTGSNP